MQIDNTSDVSAINKMGSVKSIEMNNEVHLIWESIGTQNNWLTATHMLGLFNEDADRESRKQKLRTDWMQNRKDFHYVTKKLNAPPSIDLFASRPKVLCFSSIHMFVQSYSENKAR